MPRTANVVHIDGDGPIHFQNSTFTNVAGNMSVSHTVNTGESGLEILYRAVSQDAMHDSAERPADPSYYPGTRSAILDELDKWSSEQPSNSPILWLHGCAGIGKSAIAQQFAASCHDRSQLGGSFFFKRGSVSRGTWRNLLPTLVYQMAAAFPQLGPIIQRSIETDRLVLGKAMHYQLEKLMIQPFAHAPMLGSRPILVLDGLDECEDRGVQTMLIRALIDILRSGHAPLHILICSRSEPHLREVFEASENSDVCRGLEIRRDNAAYADIHQYLTDEFSRIRRLHTSRGTMLEEGWPGEHTIGRLAYKSYGTFIYASTIVRYVDDEYSHPAEQLDRVLSLDPASLTPLDDLYTQILSDIPNKPTLIRVLHAIVEIRVLDPEQIDIALQIRRGTSRAVLRGLHSVIKVHPVRILGHPNWVQFLHASFRDFLVDSHRSLSFCVSREDLQSALLHDIAAALSSGSLELCDFGWITDAFLHCFRTGVPPSEKFLPVFRNVNFQHRVYEQECDSDDVSKIVPGIITWLEGYSPLPLDLIKPWTNLNALAHTFDQSKPTSPVHQEYQAVSHPEYLESQDLLSVLRAYVVFRYWDDRITMTTLLNVFGLKWDVLVPLTKVAETNTVDIGAIRQFLSDPEKCGALFMPLGEILRFTALQCIQHMKYVLGTKDFFHHNDLLDSLLILLFCEPNAEVLYAFEDLDLTQLCSSVELDKKYHLRCHRLFLAAECFGQFLQWLREAPSPQPRLIHAWEQQQKAVEECYARLIGGTGDGGL